MSNTPNLTYEAFHADDNWKVSSVTEYRKDNRWHKVINHTPLKSMQSPEQQINAARDHGADAVCLRLFHRHTERIYLLDVPMFKYDLIITKINKSKQPS